MACTCTPFVYEPHRPRGAISAMYSTPGPCYMLPGLVGKPGHDYRSVHTEAPEYSFRVRHGKFRDDCSPGPAAYFPGTKIFRDGADGTPHYSLYSRNKDLTSFRSPGPGAYAPERAGPTSKRAPPAYSFGSRTRTRTTDSNPGPNAYPVPGMLGKTVQSSKRQAPCFSLTGRSKVGGFHEDLQKTPGPGNYHTIDPNLYKNKLPSYTLSARCEMPGDATRKPGPGAYSPERVCFNSRKRCAPCPSFGIRHSPYTAPLIVEIAD